jgi:hypothetical protein
MNDRTENNTWPTDPSITEFLYGALMREQNDRYAGADNIARALSNGGKVLTTPSALDIWRGGLGNFIKVNRNPVSGVGVVEIWMDASVWGAALLHSFALHYLTEAQDLEKEAIRVANGARSAFAFIDGARSDNQSS